MNIKELSENIVRRSELFAEVVSACSTLLKHSPNASHVREYINNRLSLKAQQDAGLGYFPSNKDLNNLFDLVSKDTLKELGIVYDKRIAYIDVNAEVSHSIFNHHNLIMPYKNLYGDIIALVGRTLLTSEEQKNLKISKYKNSQFQKRLHLFGLHKAKNSILKKNAVILVEGQFDCISCHRHGVYNVVAVGSANLSKYQFFILKRYTNNFYLLFDNDYAGNKGMDKIINKYSNDAIIQKITIPDEYKDIDEYLQKDMSCDIFNF